MSHDSFTIHISLELPSIHESRGSNIEMNYQ